MKNGFKKKNKSFYLLILLPAVALYSLALVVPLFCGTIPSSLYDWNIIKGQREFIGLENFAELLGDGKFFAALRAYAKSCAGSVAPPERLVACFADRGAHAEGIIESFLRGTCVI